MTDTSVQTLLPNATRFFRKFISQSLQGGTRADGDISRPLCCPLRNINPLLPFFIVPLCGTYNTMMVG